MDLVGLACLPDRRYCVGAARGGRPSPMRAGMPFSRWSGLPEKTISMRQNLSTEPNPAAELPRPPNHRKQSNEQAAPRRTAPNSGELRQHSAAKSVLGEQLSASLRESLIEQIAIINSADEAAAWAHRNLPAKNTLTAPDAKIVEEHFQARLAKISEQAADEASDVASVGPPQTVSDQCVVSIGRSEACDSQKPSAKAKKQSRREVIGALGKTVRPRDKDHRRFVLRQACLVCGRVPSDPHHLTFTQPRALGRRVSDEFIVPVCRIHHRELHRSGNEAAWWRKFNINPIPIALRLWEQTRTDGGQSDPKLWKNARLDEGRTASSQHRKVPPVTELQKRRPKDGRYAQRDGAL